MSRKRKRPNTAARRARAAAAPAAKQAQGVAGAPARARHVLDNWLLGLAALGVLLTGYLTAVAWFGEYPAYCGADSECDIVQSSRWSTLLGLPMALWGLLTYAGLAGLAWRLRSRPAAWGAMLLFACIGATTSAISVKTEGIGMAEMLISTGIGRKAPYFHRSWILLPPDTAEDEMRHRIRMSYDLIRSKLPGKVRATLDPP